MKPVRIFTSHAMISRLIQISWPRAGHAQRNLGGRVEGVVLHDAVAVHQVVADHPAQLGVGVGPVRAQRVEERDVLSRTRTCSVSSRSTAGRIRRCGVGRVMSQKTIPTR